MATAADALAVETWYASETASALPARSRLEIVGDKGGEMAGKIDHALERLIFFSDAVFAIAITLLVIEIHVPHIESGSPDLVYWAALAQLIPNFVGFAVSFGVIGIFWAGHHRAFCLAGRYQGRAARWNLVFLGAIAFIPFVTAFSSLNPGLRIPAVLYWVWLLLTALLKRS